MEPRYGYDLMRATGLKSGSIYPALRLLTDAGMVPRRRGGIDPAAEGRPARRSYTLTGSGRLAAALPRELSEASPPPARPGGRWGCLA